MDEQISTAKFGKSRLKLSDTLVTPTEDGRRLEFINSKGDVSLSGHAVLSDALALTLAYDLLMSFPEFEYAIKLVHAAFFAELGTSEDHKSVLEKMLNYASANAHDMVEAYCTAVEAE